MASFLEVEKPLSKIGKSVLGDLRNSFRWSQFNLSLQLGLLSYYARQYKPGAVEDFDFLVGEVNPHIHKLTVPSGHTDKYPSLIDSDAVGDQLIVMNNLDQSAATRFFSFYWRNYQAMLAKQIQGEDPLAYSKKIKRPVYDYQINRLASMSEEELAVELAYEFAERDIHYQNERRHDPDNPHGSYIRTYALLHLSSPGSEVMISVFEGVRVSVTEAYFKKDEGKPNPIKDLNAKTHELVSAWESNHPGEAFWANLN